MAVRRSAVHKNHNRTLYITKLATHTYIFIMVAYPGHNLKCTKWIEIKLGAYIDVNDRKYRHKNHNPILHFT